MHQDIPGANTVTLYKNKEDRSDYNNYRNVSLLSIVGGICARVVLNRLQKLACTQNHNAASEQEDPPSIIFDAIVAKEVWTTTSRFFRSDIGL